MPRQETIAIYFKSLQLTNVKCFEDVCLKLTDEDGNIAQWTLLLGDNGVGKTTLLQCLCWMRPTFEEIETESNTVETLDDTKLTDDSDNDLSEPIEEGYLKSSLTVEDNLTLEALLRINKMSEFTLEAELCQGAKLNSPNLVTRAGLKSNRVITKITLHDKNGILSKDPTEDKMNIKSDLGKFWDPLIVTYGANRWSNLEYTGETKIEDPLAANFSVKGTELKDAEKELIVLYQAAEEKKRQRLEEELERLKISPNAAEKTSGEENNNKSTEEKLLDVFLQTIAKVLPDDFNAEGNIKIEPPQYVDGELKNAELKIKIMGEDIPFSELSLGYQSTLTWVLDLCWQLFNKYPKSASPLHEPAVVIIDEIDLHLHPHWQWSIMRKLAEWFPRVQFIGTSHSPLMVQSMPDANFEIMQKCENKVEIENDPEKVRGWRIDQILNSEYFGFNHAWDAETEEIFKERRALLKNKERTDEQEARLKDLEDKILLLPTETNPEDREAMDLIREAAAALKNRK